MLMPSNAQSIRQVLRGLWRTPAFTLTVVGCLALGFTAQASVLNILNAVVLRPLPFPQPDELLQIGLGDGNVANLPVPGREYQAWLRSNQSLVSTATYRTRRATLEREGYPLDLQGAVVSVRLADVLRVQPASGRFLNSDDEQTPGGSVVLGHRVWSTQFGGDSSIVGRSIRLSERSVTVVGVMPPGFDFPQGAEFWLAESPVAIDPGAYYTIIGRRRPALSTAAVRADLTRIPRLLSGDTPRNIADAKPTVVLLRDSLYGTAQPAVLLVFAGATLLLVVGGVGVANLMLARNAARRPEIALRFALGAPRSRIVALIVAECVLLAIAAGLLGLLLSLWVSRLIVDIGPPILETLPSIMPDWRVLLILLLITIAFGFAVGIGTAWRATRDSGAVNIVARGAVGADGRTFRVVRRVLVATQIAMAMLLMSGAGVLASTLARKASLPLGFDDIGVMVATLRLPRTRYETPASARLLFDAIRRDLVRMPHVSSVTYGTPPMSGFEMMASPPPGATGPTYEIATDAVGPDYFATYGIPIQSGRAIGPDDDANGQPVVVINQAAKDLIFPTRSPLGEVLTAMTVRNQHPRVVGVAANVPQYDVGMPILPAAFASLAQVDGRPLELAVRTTGAASTLIAPMRQIISQHDPRLAVGFSPLEEAVRRSVAPNVFTTTLAAAFAGLALMIATIGLFGLLSYFVTQRTREMGIRVALGARPSDIAVLVLREGLSLVVVGVVLGVVVTLALNTILAALIVDFGGGSLLILLAAGTLVVGVTSATMLLPALRASKVDPMRALRSG